MQFLQNLLDGAHAVRWLIVIVAFVVLVVWLAETIHERNMAEDERDEAEAALDRLGQRHDELRAERDSLLKAIGRRAGRQPVVAGRRAVRR